jgi:hypothetical protein
VEFLTTFAPKDFDEKIDSNPTHKRLWIEFLIKGGILFNFYVSIF